MRNTIAFFIYMCITINVSAQPIFWKTDHKSYYVGDSFIATIIVADIDIKGNPILSPSDNFTFQFLEKNKITTEETTTTTYRYKCIPLKSGSLYFPNVGFNSKKNIKTENYKVLVKLPKKNPNIKLDVTLSDNECYQSQPITLYFSWKCAIPLSNLKAANIDIPVFEDKSIKVIPPYMVKDFEKTNIGLPVSGNRIISNISDLNINKVPYKEISFKLTIIPYKTGVLEIAPSTLLCSYLQQKSSFNSYPAYFDNNLFDVETSEQYQRLVAQSKPIKLLVKELPKENRPDNFSGLFDSFAIESSINKSEVKTGEPLKLKLSVKDYQYIEAFTLPDFSTLLSNKKWYRYTETPPTTTITDTLLTFEKLLRIKSTEVEMIPSLKIPYFNTKTNKYDFVITTPIDITVAQGPMQDNFNEADSIQSTPKNYITENSEGILQLYTNENALEKQSKNENVWFWIMLFVLPVFTLIMAKTQQYYSSEKTKNRNAIKRALKYFNKTTIQNNNQLEAAISTFFNQGFQLQNSIIMPQQIINIVEEHCNGTNIDTLLDFYKNHYSKTYSKQMTGNEINISEIKACINQISKNSIK